jgi:hypothetical protein
LPLLRYDNRSAAVFACVLRCHYDKIKQGVYARLLVACAKCPKILPQVISSPGLSPIYTRIFKRPHQKTIKWGYLHEFLRKKFEKAEKVMKLPALMVGIKINVIGITRFVTLFSLI